MSPVSLSFAFSALSYRFSIPSDNENPSVMEPQYASNSMAWSVALSTAASRSKIGLGGVSVFWNINILFFNPTLLFKNYNIYWDRIHIPCNSPIWVVKYDGFQ